MPCWASTLGNCQGPLTGEHIFTNALIETKTVKVVGAPWTAEEAKIIGRNAVVANVLCKGHNNELGRHVDKAAVRLRHLLIFSNNPLQRPGSLVLQPPPDVTVSGVEFARWLCLCKTHCNVMAATHHAPHPAYVNYAFGRKPPEHLWFYFQHHPGKKVVFGDTDEQAIASYGYMASEERQTDAFSINLCGYKTLVSREAIPPLRKLLMQVFGVDWYDRLNQLVFPTDLGPYRINFSWAGDPCLLP